MPQGLSLARLVPNLDRQGNLIREGWDRLSSLPGGKRLFSRAIGQMAPYTGSIDATIEELALGHAKVVMHERRALRNHLKSVHAIALANLAELTGNIAFMYGLPDDARFIVAGLSIDYLKKARGTITGTSSCPIPRTSTRAEYEVPVAMWDAAGDEVARATLRSLVGPKRS